MQATLGGGAFVTLALPHEGSRCLFPFFPLPPPALARFYEMRPEKRPEGLRLGRERDAQRATTTRIIKAVREKIARAHFGFYVAYPRTTRIANPILHDRV